jgi:tRNA(Arg) A34 adenosine deaminase TadA
MTGTVEEQRTVMKSDIEFLKLTVELSKRSRSEGNHPFGAILVDPDGGVIEQAMNSFPVDRGPGHAEANLARAVARKYEPEFLRRCTLYTSVEPCSMCSGTIYWASIGAVVFGLSERRLGELTGDNPENRTQDLPCREIFKAGRWQVEVRGPFPEVEDEVLEPHLGFWNS